MFSCLFRKVPEHLPSDNYKIIELPNGRFAPMIRGAYEWRIIDYVSGGVVQTWCAPKNVLNESVRTKKQAYKKIWEAFLLEDKVDEERILQFIAKEQRK